MDSTHFWEARARRFASQGDGLRAICSFAMPGFYNWSIDVTQRWALRAVLGSIRPGTKVLDYGCGIGRWSREMAGRGAHVTACDFSATMLAEARRRTERVGLGGACRFIQADVTRLDLDEQFDLIIGVTVLQHVLGDAGLATALTGLARRLRPGGRLIMLEAAPLRHKASCETATFRVRPLETYLEKIAAAGLRVTHLTGVDPIPFKLWVVPRFRSLPQSVGRLALSLVTLVALPLDLLLQPLLVRQSWHKIFVCESAGAGS